MNWILIAIGAFFAGAGSNLADRFLLTKRVSNYLVYTFYVGLMSVFIIFLAPFSFFNLSLTELATYLFSGFIFLTALFFFFYSIGHEEATKVVPVWIGFTPCFALLLSYYFLNQPLTQNELMAFIFLVFGGVLMAYKKNSPAGTWTVFLAVVLSSFLLALNDTILKYIFTVYSHRPFVGIFYWTRMGGLVTAMFLLFLPGIRKAVMFKETGRSMNTGLVFMSGKIAGSLSSILLVYAVSLGNIAIINSLKGLQYGFLFIGTLFLSKKYPNIIKEQFTKKDVLQKITAFSLITAGLVILFL